MHIPPPGVIRNSGLHFDQSFDLPVQRERRCAYLTMFDNYLLRWKNSRYGLNCEIDFMWGDFRDPLMSDDIRLDGEGAWPSLDHDNSSQSSTPLSLLPFGNVLDKPFIIADGAGFVLHRPGIY
jgi:hypothetical protein